MISASTCSPVLIAALVLAWVAVAAYAAEPAGSPSTTQGELPKVTRVLLLIGQSNMAGRGLVEAQDQEAHPRVLVMGKDGRWAPARDPLHWDKPQMAGVGPGLAFGKALAEAWPDETIGLVPAAFGGTSIQQWQKGSDDPLKLYATAVERAKVATKDAPLAGIIWHQGEANTGTEPAEYARLFGQLMADLRQELGDCPVVAGELGHFLRSNRFNALLQDLPKSVARMSVVSAEGLVDKGDKLHFDAASARELGRRYAQAMLKMQ